MTRFESSLLILAFWILVVVLLHGVVTRGLFRLTEPLRGRMLETTRKILSDTATSDSVKRLVVKSLKDVYSVRSAWKLTLMLVCIITTAPFHRFRSTSLEEIPYYLRESYREFQLNWLIATLANSPFAAGFFLILLVLMMAFYSSFRRLYDCLNWMAHRGHGDGAVRA
jgi:hypothetical protein